MRKAVILALLLGACGGGGGPAAKQADQAQPQITVSSGTQPVIAWTFGAADSVCVYSMGSAAAIWCKIDSQAADTILSPVTVEVVLQPGEYRVAVITQGGFQTNDVVLKI